MWRRPAVTFVNGRVVTPAGTQPGIRVVGGRVAPDVAPQKGDVVVDLHGACVLPGLINAHDHLELNHFGVLGERGGYCHADDWIAALRPRLRSDPQIRRHVNYPLADRLFIGGLKNLLSGATTVAHHNPRYRQIGWRFPVRVLERYRWAHSYSMSAAPVGALGEPGGDVARTCASTPGDVPFIVHVGEGTDERASAELRRFAADGCLRPNSLIVHGVAHTADSWRNAIAAGTGLVWCPVSNVFLFGRTVAMGELMASAPGSEHAVCLGTDSRLTGAFDILDELRAAAASGLAPDLLLRMVTTTPSRLLRAPWAGQLAPGGPADLVVVPADPTAPGDPARALIAAQRRDVGLVMLGGHPVVGEPRYAPLFDASGDRSRPMRVDGVPRLAAKALVRRLARCVIREPGVELGS